MEESQNPKLLSPLTLAFLGDGVFELLVREYVVETFHSMPANKLHRLAVGWVCAGAQSEAYRVIEPLLSEEELQVMKRGRNANVVTAPKNAKTADYRRATGVEALFGYLFLKGERARVRELFHVIVTNGEGATDGTTDNGAECAKPLEGSVL